MTLANNLKPDIIFRPNGLIEFSAKVVRLLGIENGDAINITEEQGEYCLFIEHKKPHGSFKGMCRPAKRSSRFMRTNWAELSRGMIRLSGKKTAFYRVGEPFCLEQKKYLPIITRIAL